MALNQRMNMTHPPLTQIPTNLITGFLGCGKTTAILDLLEQKSDDARWAVLVNEFGDAGIDGALYERRGIAIKEVPGGCLCCTAGVPLQTAVNRLLREARPQRLLIEASGLGHPARVIDTLRNEHFRNVLDLHATLCLIDPRNLLDRRYTGHETFNDQITVADILIANKTDLCTPPALQAFQKLVNRLDPPKQVVAQTRFGRLDPQWLDLDSDPGRCTRHETGHDHDPGGGWRQQSWRFPPTTRFHQQQLVDTLLRLDQPRIKALIQTEVGWRHISLVEKEQSSHETPPQQESRIVVIHAGPLPDDVDDKIRAAIIRSPD